MKPYLKLYLKELKFISGISLLLLLLTVGAILYESIMDIILP